MRIVAAPDGVVGIPDRALWITRPFDLAWSGSVVTPTVSTGPTWLRIDSEPLDGDDGIGEAVGVGYVETEDL